MINVLLKIIRFFILKINKRVVKYIEAKTNPPKIWKFFLSGSAKCTNYVWRIRIYKVKVDINHICSVYTIKYIYIKVNRN